MAQQITKAEVKKVAGLARLNLSSSDADLYTRQLDEVLNYVSQLPEEDVQGNIKESAQNIDQLRKDEIKPSKISQQKLLSNVPVVENGSIKVPAILVNKD